MRSMTTGLLLAGGASSFSPFAGVEELKPQRLEQFCSKETFPSQDGKSQLRKCSHLVRKTLEDGGKVELGWQMHVDPDRILSLDTEAEHGARLTRCSPDELELELPESHARHAAEGHIIVASRFLHGCEHMPDKHLFHRVLEVKQHDWMQGGPGVEGSRVAVRLSTQELPSLAQAVEFVDFHFSYIPIEATDLVSFPEMRTDFGLNRPILEKQARRLSGFPSLSGMLHNIESIKIEGLEEDSGNFHHAGESHTSINTDNDILNLMPKQVSNFGWNWDFGLNTTEEPELNMNGPGSEGFIKIKNPYVKIHAGIYVNFTSRFFGPFGLPHVHWTAGIKGHGHLQGRIIAALNTTGDAGVDPVKTFKVLDIPILEQLRHPVWFNQVDFATGSLPVSVEPGWEFNAKLYHRGEFKGTAVFGGKTHGTMNPSMSFDSLKGFESSVEGELLDTDVWPPMWIIFTKHFEMGLMLRPSLLMKGDMFGLEEATAAIDLALYLNLTIRREGSNTGLAGADAMQKLTVYPFRVMGLQGIDFHTRYRVRISVSGVTLETKPAMNWGEVLFHEHVSNFDCGIVPQQVVMEQGITVTLIKVTDNKDHPDERPLEEELGSGKVEYKSLLNQVCQPSPSVANIKDADGKDVATVELLVVMQDAPDAWFASKIRGVSLSFPEVMLRQDALQQQFPSLGGVVPEVTLHLLHGGKTFISDVKQAAGGTIQRTPMHGESTLEFPPGFVDVWLPCPLAAAKCDKPRIELYAGHVLIASAPIPELQWTSAAPAPDGSNNFLEYRPSEVTLPATVAMYAPGSLTSTIALVKMQAQIFDPSLSSLFIKPTASKEVSLDDSEQLMWLISSCSHTKAITFHLSARKLSPVLEAFSMHRRVGDMELKPIPGSQQEEYLKCKERTPNSNSDDPCPFTVDWEFDSALYAVGDIVVVLIQWTCEGSELHEMYTPPFKVLPLGGRRRLSEEPARKLWNSEDWNSHIEKNKASCEEKDLHFNLGAGVLARARIDSFGVPKGFPMLGGLDEAPIMVTEWHPIGAIKPGTDAREIFPEILCEGGLCQGALPGCREAQFKLLHFPRIIIDFNRPFAYNKTGQGHFTEVLEEAMAVGFSMMPEMVDIGIRELNMSRARHRYANMQSQQQPTTNNPPLPASMFRAPQIQQPAVPRYPTAVAATGSDDTNQAFNQWWSGVQRRLLGVMETKPEPQPGHQVEVRFKKGLPYIVDRQLMDMMLQHGYFMEVEDDASKTLGPLRIVSYHIDHSEDTPAHGSMVAGWFGQQAVPGMVGGIAALAATSLFGLWRVRTAVGHQKRAYATTTLLAAEDELQGGLE